MSPRVPGSHPRTAAPGQASGRCNQPTWPDDEEVEAACVSVVVARLRRKFHGKQLKAQIDPVNRFGYRLSCHRLQSLVTTADLATACSCQEPKNGTQ
ncbi:helix-turn-helix domain-containing protein [Paraburkholderia terrae]|uniref:Helix-turn-helix domain-containing protein n=1 Tax=Paraburkholderia terrae TaxID=311230 RepID=A0A2I8F4A8_9BURK|nr:helix-turn-helix domain-containing protein [Paraburkholderia terrae]